MVLQYCILYTVTAFGDVMVSVNASTNVLSTYGRKRGREPSICTAPDLSMFAFDGQLNMGWIYSALKAS